MQVNPTYVHIGQKSSNGTQNISLYNPKTKSYLSMISNPSQINAYVKSTNSKRIKADIFTAIFSFAGGMGIATLLNAIFKSKSKINLFFFGVLTSVMCSVGNLGDSFVYTKENKKFISQQENGTEKKDKNSRTN